MDSEQLHFEIDRLSTCGVLLSTEEKSCLQTSLVTLKSNQKFRKVIFWGKIFGVQSNYYIAQGLGVDEMADRKSLYSVNGLDWAILPKVDSDLSKKVCQLRGRFTGDPSFEMEYKIERRQHPAGDNTDGAEGRVDMEEITVKEEDRLAAVIEMIDKDSLVVPRGAYVRRAMGSVAVNRTFDGLSPAEANLARNYMHLRKKVEEERTDGSTPMIQPPRRPVPGLDFLDCIESDLPEGCWTFQLHRGSTVIMRSLLWVGYYFYHVPNTRQYGSIYFGNGEKNLDLPFML